ncbi:MAG TPA: hypothetical protein VGK19_16055 [Capsulimonadaceae bacterium]
MSLNVLVLPLDPYSQVERTKTRVATALGKLLRSDDRYEIGDIDRIKADPTWDLIIVWEPCGWHKAARPVAESGIPCFPLAPPLVYHPYAASFISEVRERGGMLLPAIDEPTVAASIMAVRARQTLASMRLLVVNANEGNVLAEQVQEFSTRCKERLGIAVDRRSAIDLNAIADSQSDAAVDAEWQRWLAELLIDGGEMGEAHMRQVLRLYLAERALLAEHQADGITVDDIGAFLMAPGRPVMPNSSYAALAHDGFLCCEEGDIQALATEAVLRSSLGAHPTMSNIYMAYRDAMNALVEGEPYNPEFEAQDFAQCLADDHLVAAHFSTSGVLPPNMMVEERYRIRETYPAWRGQSMTAATPRLGPVVLARLGSEADMVHLVSGVVDECRMDDTKGWYRGRWMIKIPSALSFVENAIHQHYAIGPENGRAQVLDILTKDVLRLRRVDLPNFS